MKIKKVIKPYSYRKGTRAVSVPRHRRTYHKNRGALKIISGREYDRLLKKKKELKKEFEQKRKEFKVVTEDRIRKPRPILREWLKPRKTRSDAEDIEELRKKEQLTEKLTERYRKGIRRASRERIAEHINKVYPTEVTIKKSPDRVRKEAFEIARKQLAEFNEQEQKQITGGIPISDKDEFAMGISKALKMPIKKPRRFKIKDSEDVDYGDEIYEI